MQTAGALLISYLIGSIPSALIAGKILLGVDIRTIGSGNAGATNLYRAAGLRPYLMVLAADIFKGYAATEWIAGLASSGVDAVDAMIACGLAAVIGHVFTVFASFKGGKGVATAAGMMLAFVPGPLLGAIAVYFVILYFTSYVSLGSIGAAVSLPLTLAFSHFVLGASIRMEIQAITVVLALLILVTHRENIARLIKGEERKTEFFKKGP